MATKNLHEFKKEYFKKEENTSPIYLCGLFVFYKTILTIVTQLNTSFTFIF